MATMPTALTVEMCANIRTECQRLEAEYRGTGSVSGEALSELASYVATLYDVIIQQLETGGPHVARPVTRVGGNQHGARVGLVGRVLGVVRDDAGRV